MVINVLLHFIIHSLTILNNEKLIQATATDSLCDIVNIIITKQSKHHVHYFYSQLYINDNSLIDL